MNFRTKLNMKLACPVKKEKKKLILLKGLSTNLVIAFQIIIFLGFSSSAMAQDEIESKQALVLSGSIDTYFRTGDFDDGATNAPASSFANGTGFSLGMINIIGNYDGEKSGFVADIVIGPRGADAVFGSPAGLNLVNQLYAYLNVTDKITFTIGNFNTFLGYEVISPTANYNYSTSYMFSYGPFSHTGFKADFDLGKGFSFMAGVFNPTDATDINPDGTYTAGGQLGYSGEKGSVYLNLLIDEEYSQLDLTTGMDISDNLYLGFNGTYSDLFYGAAAYAQVSTSDALSFGIRAEYFADESGVAITNGESIIDLTISANYKVGKLTVIPEFRIDSGSNDEFFDSDLKPTKSLSSFLVAAVYSF